MRQRLCEARRKLQTGPMSLFTYMTRVTQIPFPTSVTYECVFLGYWPWYAKTINVIQQQYSLDHIPTLFVATKSDLDLALQVRKRHRIRFQEEYRVFWQVCVLLSCVPDTAGNGYSVTKSSLMYIVDDSGCRCLYPSVWRTGKWRMYSTPFAESRWTRKRSYPIFEWFESLIDVVIRLYQAEPTVRWHLPRGWRCILH